MIFVLTLLSILTGGLLVTQRIINSTLGKNIGNMESSFWNHLIGAVFSIILLALGLGYGMLRFKGIPVQYFMGGCVGIFMVYLMNISLPKIGAMAVSISLVFSQFLMATFIDYFGLFGAPISIPSPLKICGILLILMGVIMVSLKKSNNREQFVMRHESCVMR